MKRLLRRGLLAVALVLPACGSWCNRAPEQKMQTTAEPRIELTDPGREPRAELEVGRWSGFRYWLALENDASFGVVGMPLAKAPTTEMTLAFEVLRGTADPIVREQEGIERSLIEERSVIEGVRLGSTELAPEAMAQLQTAFDGLLGTTTKQLVAQNGEIVELEVELVGGLEPPPDVKRVLDEGFDLQRRFPFRLPPSPVGVGARWRFSEAIELRGVRATQVAEMTLIALDARTARIGIRLRLQAGTQMIPHPLEPGRQATLESFRGDGDGELEIERQTAVVLSSRLATTAKLELSSIDAQQGRQVATFMSASVLRGRGGAGPAPIDRDGAAPRGQEVAIPSDGDGAAP
jgi:hypothetical protein